jgi:hypothetical protein
MSPEYRAGLKQTGERIDLSVAGTSRAMTKAGAGITVTLPE